MRSPAQRRVGAWAWHRMGFPAGPGQRRAVNRPGWASVATPGGLTRLWRPAPPGSTLGPYAWLQWWLQLPRRHGPDGPLLTRLTRGAVGRVLRQSLYPTWAAGPRSITTRRSALRRAAVGGDRGGECGRKLRSEGVGAVPFPD